MTAPRIEAGRLVRSKAGRDAGRLFVVVEVLDEDFALACDGRLRTLDRPKKKRLKHLRPLPCVFEAVAQGGKVENHQLRQWICEEEEKLVQV